MKIGTAVPGGAAEDEVGVQENRIKRLKMAIAAQSVLCMIALAGIFCVRQNDGTGGAAESGIAWAEEAVSDGYIKWVDFTVTYEALCRAYEWDVNTAQDAVHIDWVEMLAYLGRVA